MTRSRDLCYPHLRLRLFAAFCWRKTEYGKASTFLTTSILTLAVALYPAVL